MSDCRLLNKAHLRRPILRMGAPRTSALAVRRAHGPERGRGAAAYLQYAWTHPSGGYPGLRRAALPFDGLTALSGVEGHLDLCEQPGRVALR
jgi:hypothetical protein